MREWAIFACKGRLLLSGSVVLASLKAAVYYFFGIFGPLSLFAPTSRNLPSFGWPLPLSTDVICVWTPQRQAGDGHGRGRYDLSWRITQRANTGLDGQPGLRRSQAENPWRIGPINDHDCVVLGR